MMGDLVPSGSKYTDADRRAAVVEYIVLGNASRVANRLNMPASTLAQWRASSWWPAMYAEHIEQVNDEILANNLRIATMA